MLATSLPVSSSPASKTSLRQRLFNILVSPSDVFDEVISSPRNLANWRIPTLLVCLVNIIALQTADIPAHTTAKIHNLLENGAISVTQAHALAGAWPIVSALIVCLVTFAGTCWSAFVLWFIGRVFLKVRFPYSKSLEMVGLTGAISILGSITAMLLIAASGDPATRPGLSLLATKLDHTRPLYQILEMMNFFQLWSISVIAIGLSRLCKVTSKEAAFWVFGYWLGARIFLIILQ